MLQSHPVQHATALYRFRAEASHCEHALLLGPMLETGSPWVSVPGKAANVLHAVWQSMQVDSARDEEAAMLLCMTGGWHAEPVTRHIGCAC